MIGGVTIMQNVLIAFLILVAAQSQVQAATGHKTLEVNFTDLTYIDEGEGSPVVFVHGSMGDMRSFDAVRPAISREFRFISYSRRYHFPNKWDDQGDNYTMTQHVEDLAEFIRGLNLGPVHLVGGSYGGRMAGLLALRNPELIRSLVLNDPFLVDPDTARGKHDRERFFADIRKVSQLLNEQKMGEALRVFYNANNAPRHHYKETGSRFRKIARENDNILQPLLRAVLPPSPSCERISRLKMPVLLLEGEDTREYYRLGDRRLMACLPKATGHVLIPHAGHMIFLHNPRATAQALLKFIRANDAKQVSL